MSDWTIRSFEDADEAAVIELWIRCALTRPWNDPGRDIERKRAVQRDLFLVAESNGVIVGSVMAGYDGHRGWLNYLAVDPDCRRQGLGKALVDAAEARLRALGCPKINLQVRRGNELAVAFYESIGFKEDDVRSFGKRLIEDGPRW